MFSSFQLPGPWFESTGLAEVDRKPLLLLLLLAVVVEVVEDGCGGGLRDLARSLHRVALQGSHRNPFRFCKQSWGLCFSVMCLAIAMLKASC